MTREAVNRSFLLVILGLAALGAEARSVPEGVSPGRTDHPSVVAGARPTFSWAAVPGAEGYELLLYRVSAGASGEAAPVARMALPAGAQVWTPDTELAPGVTYAWAVRALGVASGGAAAGTGTRAGARGEGESRWSPPRFFTVQASPSLEEVRRALATLDRYVADGGELPQGELTPSTETSPSAATPKHAPRESGEATEGSSEADENDRKEAASNPVAPAGPGTFSQAPAFDTMVGPNVLGARVAAESGNTQIRGYLGIGEGTLDFDEVVGLNIAGDEIGMLGVSIDGGGLDNVGVYGFSDGWGGIFTHEDNVNLVRLGGSAKSIEALGDATVNGDLDVFGNITSECPSTMERIGYWCIDKSIGTAASLTSSVQSCHDRGAAICPLQAILTCHTVKGNSSGNDCGSRSKDGGPLRVFGTWFERDASNLLRANPYGAVLEWDGNSSGTGAPKPQVRPTASGTSLAYFCCKIVN